MALTRSTCCAIFAGDASGGALFTDACEGGDMSRALILAADGFEDSELLVPYYRLKEADCTVDIAGPESGAVLTGKHGYTVKTDLAFDDIKPGDYDALVIPGGRAPETVRLSAAALRAVREIMKEEKPVASICHGAQVLISAGVIADRSATCWQGIRDDVKAAGAHYSDEEVVVDRNLITSRSPEDLPAFCRELLKQIH